MSGSVQRFSARFGLAMIAVLAAALFLTPAPGMAAPASGAPAPGATLTVDIAADTVDANDGHCSLREAIVAANTNTASGSAAGECPAGSTKLDRIAISVPPDATVTLALASQLPDITAPVIVDGSTQSAGSPPTVLLDGAGSIGQGFVFAPGSKGSKLIGFKLTGFYNAAVELDGGGVTLQRNWIGTADGTTPSGSMGSFQAAVRIMSSGNRIGLLDPTFPDLPSNIIDNTVAGIDIQSGSGNIIQSNYIGTSMYGLSAIGNGYGIILSSGVTGTLIGGPNSGLGNLISGNGTGIAVNPGVKNTKIVRNKIGSDLYISNPVANSVGIMEMGGTGTLIGGSMPVASNVISGNGAGIQFQGSPAVKTTIAGNLFGVSHTGGSLPNQWHIVTFNASRIILKSNLIAHASSVAFDFNNGPANLAGSTNNCIRDNDLGATNRTAGLSVSLSKNWWGHASGPYSDATHYTGGTPNLGGQGDKIVGPGTVVFAPWLTKAPASCQGWGATPISPREGSFAPSVSTLNIKSIKTARADYGFSLDDDPAFGSPLLNATMYVPPARIVAVPFGKWYWKTTTFVDGFTWESETHTFWVTIMKSPKPGAKVKAGKVKFSWSAYNPAPAGYTWGVFDNEACTNPDGTVTPNVNTAVMGASTTATVSGPGTRYWKVSINGGPEMPCWSFSVQ